MRIDVKQCVACLSEAFVFYELSVSKLEFKRFTAEYCVCRSGRLAAAADVPGNHEAA